MIVNGARSLHRRLLDSHHVYHYNSDSNRVRASREIN